MNRLAADTRGAAMVFGLFFAVFLLAMLWYLVGIADALHYRQHVQDAADAGAFSAAVVNARGMNLLALINMTMAAVLSVLVGLRLTETLGMVSIGICYGLSWITGGASMVPVPLLQSATRTVQQAADRVEKQIPNILSPLHMAGKAVSVVVPVGANLQVIGTVVSDYDVAGFAIPARLTLPVEDDEFDVLCAHAGALAANIMLFPISPILPDKIEQKISGASGKLADAGSDWFCGGKGDPPDLNDDEDTKVIEYPIMPRQKKCTELVDKAQKSQSSDPDTQAQIERVCSESGVEYLASLPNRNGNCRHNQPLCPTDCEEDPRASCPPEYFQDCELDEASKIAALGPEVIDSELVTCGPKKDDGRFDYTKTSSLTAYERRLIAAREQCDPTKPGNKHKRGFGWLQRTVAFVYEWNALRKEWMPKPDQTVYGDQNLVLHDNDDDTLPCEDLVGASEYEGKEMRMPVCQGDRTCLTPEYSSLFGVAGPCPLDPPDEGQPHMWREQVTQVMDMVRCAEEQDLTKVAVERMDVTESLKNDKKQGGKNTSPFRLEKGVWLGGSDFQLRAVVIGGALPTAGENVIKIATWSQVRKDDAATKVADAADVAASTGRVALAQAEYYFDWTGLDPQPSDQLKDADVAEWLWHMGWRARLRPFRFNHSKADGPRPNEEAGPDAEQQELMPDAAKQLKPGELDCKAGDGCDEAQQVIDVFGDGEGE